MMDDLILTGDLKIIDARLRSFREHADAEDVTAMWHDITVLQNDLSCLLEDCVIYYTKLKQKHIADSAVKARD